MINRTDIIKILPAGFYNGIIWFLSSIPIYINLHGFDKTVHILEYSGFGFLLAFGLSLSGNNFNEKARYCMILGILSGAVDEIHQYFVPGRSMDIVDLCADITGIAMGVLTLYTLLKLLEFFKKQFNTNLTESE